MSSPHKRKRPSPPSPAATSASSNTTRLDSPRSLHKTTTPVAHTNGSSSNDDLRTQLEASLAGLESTMAHIQSILQQLPPRSTPTSAKSVLSEAKAPAQPHSIPETVSESKLPPAHSRHCDKCSSLQAQISTLEKSAQEHQREREAWKAFKTWWLASLSKREHRKRPSIDNPPPNPTSLTARATSSTSSNRARTIYPASPSSSAAKDRDAGVRRNSGLEAVVKRLDPKTKAVWQRAGILPSADRNAETVDDDDDDPTRVQRGHSGQDHQADNGTTIDTGGEQGGDEVESGGQQSELTLPLHAVSPTTTSAPTPASVSVSSSPAKDALSTSTSTSTSAAPARAPAPVASSSKSSKGPLIPTATRTATESTRAITIPTRRPPPPPPPPPPSSTRTPDHDGDTDAEVGYIDSTPIRNPHVRRTLHASDCPDCSTFYSYLNDLPLPLPHPKTGSHPARRRQGDIEKWACSRHRSSFKRAITPDGYWNIAFPSTQDAELINAHVRNTRPTTSSSSSSSSTSGSSKKKSSSHHHHNNNHDNTNDDGGGGGGDGAAGNYST